MHFLNFRALIESVPKESMWACVGYPSIVTRITVRAATGLEKQDHFGGADPYCIIKCEGEKVRSFTVKNNLNPAWNSSAVFYRRSANNPIKVQVSGPLLSGTRKTFRTWGKSWLGSQICDVSCSSYYLQACPKIIWRISLGMNSAPFYQLKFI